MLKNKIIVRKIRNILILLMAMIVMVGAYRNIGRSRAEDVIEIGVLIQDNYGYLDDEEIILEAKEIENDLYEMELPESVNTKKMEQIVKVTLEDNETSQTEDTLQEENTTTDEGIILELENAEPEENNNLEIVENKIQLTKEQIENQKIKIEVVYGIKLLEQLEDGIFTSTMLMEKTSEEREQIEITEKTQVLYNKILKYEDKENAKLVEVTGFLPIDAKLQVEEVAQEKLAEIFGDKKIDVAYDIKIIREVITQIPTDEAEPNAEPEEIIETIEINPEDLGETCEVSIKDLKIQKNSNVYHVKEDNTYENVTVRENTEENISFEAQKFSIYAVSSQTVTDTTTDTPISTIPGEIIDEGINATATPGTYYLPATLEVTASGLIQAYMITNSTATPQIWAVQPGTDDTIQVTIRKPGTWYIHIEDSYGRYYEGPFTVIEKTYTGGSGGSGASSGTQSPTDTISPTISLNGLTTGGGNNSAAGTGSTITASDYGGLVTNYNPAGVDTNVGWKIFYSDSSNVYLIADYFIDVADIPKGRGGTAPTASGNRIYDVNGIGVVNDYTGTADVTSSHPAAKWLSGYLQNKYQETTYNCDKVGAYLLDTSVWSVFKDSTYAEYAIGGPTLELFAASYNATSHSNSRTFQVSGRDNGRYGIKWSTMSSYASDLNASSNNMNPAESLYVAENGSTSTINAYGMWFATTAVEELNPLILNAYGEFVSYSGVSTTYAGIRPVVCLKSGTCIEKQSNGTYLIVEPDNPNQYEYNTENINGNSTWKKTHEVTVKVEDTGSGLATGTVLQYAWQASTTTTTPTSWSTVSFASYSAGTKTIQATISQTGITGKYRLWIKATTVKDVAGNTNSDIIKTGEFWFDNTAPTATGITLSATYTKTGKITATANGVTDSHSGVSRVGWYLKDSSGYVYSNADGNGQWYKNIDVSTLSEGWYQVAIVIWDNAGNINDTTVGTSASYIGWIQFCYDKTAPTATGITLSATYTKTGKITATATGVTDNLSGVHRVAWYLRRKSDNAYVWSGEASTGQWYKSIDVSSLSEGWYRVGIVLYDNAGNSNDTTATGSSPSPIGWIEFCYDKTAPTTPTITASYNNGSGTYTSGTWTNKQVDYTVTSTDALSGVVKVEYSITNGSTWVTYNNNQTPITASGTTYTMEDIFTLRERNDTFLIRTTDAAGNVSTTSAGFNIRYDLTPPTGTITASPTTYEGTTYYTNQDSFTAYVEASDTGGSGLRNTTPVQVIAWAGGTWVSKHTTVNGSYNSSTGKYSSQFDFSNIVHTSTGSTGNGEGNYDVKSWIYDNASNSTLTSHIEMIYDKTAPTISVSTPSCTWRNSALSTTITVTDPTTNAYDGNVSGLSTSNTYQYYLSNSSTALNGGSWRDYTSGTAISLNPGVDGEYYLFVRRVNDKAGNTSTSGGTSTTVSSTTYQRFGPYQFDYTKPAITYTHQSLDIDTANKTYTMTFRGTDAHYSSGVLTLDNLTVLMQNGQLDGSGNPIVYNLKEEPVTLSFRSEAYTGANGVTGYTYILTISNLEQLEIKTGLTTADYSGVITVSVPANLLVDVAGNKNNQTTITTGVDIPGGLPTDEVPVDVVDPLWNKVSSSVDETNGTATLTVKGTDTYFDENKLEAGKIGVLVNGTLLTATDGINISLGSATALEETRTENGSNVTVQYGVQQTINVTGLPTDMEQLKIMITPGALVDKTGNTNKTTEFILYNHLKWTGLETGPQSAFLGNSSIQRKNIANVTFVSSVASANSTKWDASARGDNSILAWYETNANGSLRVYIGSNDQICANRDASYLFSYIGYGENCTTTEVITNLNLLKTSHVKNMKAMFAFTGYRSMTSLNLTGLNTSNVTNMREMFNGTGYKNMTTFTLPSTFNTSKVTDMSWMFANLGYKKMTGLTLPSNFTTTTVTDMSYMFANCGYTAMTSFNISTFNTSNVTNMSYMFSDCGYTAMTSLNISTFNTSNVTNMSYMFSNCGYTAMTSLNLGSNFSTANVIDMSHMFASCGYTKLTSLDLGDVFSTKNVTNMSDMFNGCGYTAMTSLDLGPAFTNISSINLGFLTNTGKSGSCVIYAPEAIYKNTNNLKIQASLYIPTGFSHVAGTDLSNGYTIQDSSGNQYVWIEVPRNSTVYDEIGINIDLDSLTGTALTTALNNIETELQEYAADYRNDEFGDTWYSVEQHGFTSSDDYNDLKYTMLKSVYENGGFYIGKYETGTATARNAKTDALTDAVIQANAYPYNYVTNAQAQNLASGMATGDCTSSLMFGIQWDLVLKYLESKGVTQEELSGSTTGSTNWGNYLDSTYVITNTSAKYWENTTDGWQDGAYGEKSSGTSVLLSTGADTQFNKMGIYDLAGNVYEWTLECCSDTSTPCVRRGGRYNGNGYEYPVSNRSWLSTTDAGRNLGFRVALYANEEQEAVTEVTAIEYTRGTINPKYKPEWSVTGTTITNTATTQKIDIALIGTVNTAIYSSDVTTTLEADDITVYIDGTELTAVEKSVTRTTPVIGSYIGHKLTLTNFGEALRQAGKLYKEWSGNISLKIGGRGENESTYTANVLRDSYGNQSMMETDEADGTWIDIDFKDATTSSQNTNGKLFADFVKPEVVYTYSETDINRTAKEVTVVFTIADKYYASENLTVDELTIFVDDVLPGDTNRNGVLDAGETFAMTKTLTSSDIKATVDGVADTVIGKQYTLIIKEMAQDVEASGRSYLDYAGVVTIAIPAGQVTDKSGNSNVVKTITIGVNLSPEGEVTLPTTEYTMPYLPTGFTPVAGTDLSNGLTIQDGSGNQYVWVEVPKSATVYDEIGTELNLDILSGTVLTTALDGIEEELQEYARDYRQNGYTDTYSSQEATGIASEGEYNNLKYTMLKSVYKNGGFYIGKYETGTMTKRMNGLAALSTAEIKANAYPYNFVTNKQAQEIASGMASGNYTSSLLFGIQWDLVLKYLETKGATQEELKGTTTGSTNWGNYKNSTYEITNASAKYATNNGSVWFEQPYGEKLSGTSVLLSIGADAQFNKMGIYDLAGNVYEKTLENSLNETHPCVSRGGAYSANGNSSPASARNLVQSTTSDGHFGFRVSIYGEPDMSSTNDVPQLVDLVDPKWTIEVGDGGIKLKAIDEYFKEATLTADDITVYVNGVENTVLTKDITSVPPVNILDTVDGVANTVVGKEYTLKFPNLGSAAGYTEFPVTSPVVGSTAKYRNDNAGEITIEIAAGTIEDTSGNLSEVAEKDVGNYDNTPLEVFKVQSTNDTDAKTETIIFNVTDKNYDKTDLIGVDSNSDGKIDDLNDELTIKIDGTDITDDVNVQSLSYVEIKTTVDGVERVVGHQYTLVLDNFVETDEEYIASGRDYREWSGTVSIEIAETAAKDLNGNNINPSTTTVEGDYVDYIAPEVRYTHQETDIDKTDKKYIMTFEVTDKYYASGVLTLNDLTILMQNGQLDENGDPIIYNLKDEPVSLAFNAIAKGTIGHLYTLTISDLEKFEAKTGLTTADYSGIITVAIAADKIIDDANNKNAATTITTGVDIPGGTIPDDAVEIDVVDPIWTKDSGTINIGASPATATLTINGTDTYFASGALTSSNIKVYKSEIRYDFATGTQGLVDTEITSDVTVNVSTTFTELTETRKKYNSTETETVQYGVQYTVTVSGFPINAPRVRLEIAANTLTDQSGNKNKVNYINIYNTLMATETETLATSGFLGNTSIQRQNIESVTFVSSTASANATKWDVSVDQDNSILAWYTGTNPYQVYIGSNEPIFANPISSYLFAHIGYGANCTATQTILSLNLLNTHNVTNMKGMFWYTGYKAMTSLNLGTNFKTSNVTNMSEMFTGCGYNQMTFINFGENFDTTNVTDMSWMFAEFGYKKLATLTLPTTFKTQRVTDMNNMFMNCGYTAMTTAKLGNNFYTSNVTDMTGMFNGCGYTAMTSLDLGPAFTNIASANTNFVTNTGKSGNCVINAPESIYKSRTSFKLNSSDTTNTLNYTRGTIIPKYKPEWSVTGTTITNTATTQKIDIELTGRTNITNYTANVLGNLTTNDIRIFIDNTEITDLIDISLINSNAPGATLFGDANCDGIVNEDDADLIVARTFRPDLYELSEEGLANADVNRDGEADSADAEIIVDYLDGNRTTLLTPISIEQYQVTLTNFEEALRQAGKLYKEWSGNITLKIEGRGEDATTYGKNVLVDTYGNQSMMETDESGTWIDIDFKDATASSQNTNGKLFTDFIKPEVVYTYSETDINRTTKELTVVFTIADKYYSSSSSTDLTANDLTIMVDGKIPGDTDGDGVLETGEALAITRTLTSSDIKATVDGVANTVIGKQYTLTISDFEQDELTGGKKYLDYAGIVTVAIPAGKIVDNSGNANTAQTITVGVDKSLEGGTTGAMLPSTAYTTPYMPTGFSYVEGDLDTGLVIEDGSGNEYVWVEVPRNSTVYDEIGTDLDLDTLTGTALTTALNNIETELQEYATDYREDGYSDVWSSEEATGIASEDEYNELKQTMLKSIYQNGGFYVGRYETGTTTAREDSSDELTTAVIQANAYPYDYVTNVQAQELASDFALEGYTSSLMFGIQWDLMLKHLEISGVASVSDLNSDSTEWGNYTNNEYSIANENAKYSIFDDDAFLFSEWLPATSYTHNADVYTLLTTGADSSFGKMGIYDIAGNAYEITLENASQSGYNRTLRGGDCFRNGNEDMASVHSWGDVNEAANALGFRVALYKDDTPALVDLVDPVWQLGNIDLDTGTIKIQAIDEYFDKVTIDEDDITVYVNGVPSAVVQKDITSIAPTDILDTVDGVANTVVGKEYTLKLSNITPGEVSYTTFVPTNLNSLDEETRATYEYKYKTENGGEISISIAGGTAHDTSGNVNEETDPMVIGNIDVTTPAVYEVRHTPNESAKTETIVFNVTDKNYYVSDLIGLDTDSDGDIDNLNNELTIKIDGIDVTDDVNIQSLKYVEIKTMVYGVERTVGHQYTLVLDGFEETDAEWIAAGRDYRELSGTVSIEIAPTASRDITGNTLDPTTTTVIGDYIDFINPDVKYTYSDTDIDTTNKKYTMTFSVTDKYYTSGVLQLSDLTILMYNGQKDGSGNEKVYNLQAELPSGSVRLTPTAITKDVNLTDATTGNVGAVTGHTIGHEYTLTIENLEQLVIEEGDTTANYSGVITVAIAPNKVLDRSGKGNPATTITSGVSITGDTTSGTPVEVDVVDPIWERVSSSALAKTPAQPVNPTATTGTATITIQGTDTYFATTANGFSADDSTLTSDEIEVYIDGVKNTTLTPTLTKTDTVLEESRNVFGSNPVTTETVTYGVEYTITLNGWAQGANQVKIRILEDAIKDETGNGNKAKEFMIYNCLESSAGEGIGFLDGNGVGETGPTTGIQRNQIQQVIFVDSLAGSTAEGVQKVWDVSAMTDGSIKAWTSQTAAPYTVYVGSDFEIFANQDSTSLFNDIGYAGNDGSYYTATATETISNIEQLNVSSVIKMSTMFRRCGYTAMTSLDLGDNFDTSNVTNMNNMFVECGYTAMTSLDLGDNFDTSNVEGMNGMFSRCGYTAMTSLDLSSGTPISNSTQFYTGNVVGMQEMFSECGFGAMINLNLGNNFDTSSVTNMYYMFSKCGYTAMTSLDLGDLFDTSSVIYMSGMFSDCGHTAMTSLDLGDKFDTSSVTDMSYMFSNCGSTAMTSLDLGDLFDTSSVTDMNNMFGSCGYTAMTSLDLGDLFDTSNVTDMNMMFAFCGYTAMTSLDLGDLFDTSNVTDMFGMFGSCGYTTMTSLDLGDLFDTSSVEYMDNMFVECGYTAMTSLDLGPAFTEIASTNDDMFLNTGKSGECVIYAPESIYKNRNALKLSSTDTTATTTHLTYTRGTINPKYKPEWSVTGTTVTNSGSTQKIDITLTGAVNTANYTSNVTTTLEAGDITVWIDGTQLTDVGIAITTPDPATAATISHTITLTNFAESVRRSGLKYTEWSGNIALRIAGRGEATSTYSANVLYDSYGNQSMMATDEAGATWVNVELKDATTSTQNTNGKLFADFIKPEFTYEYSETTIGDGNHGNTKILTVVFYVADKYFDATNSTGIALSDFYNPATDASTDGKPVFQIAGEAININVEGNSLTPEALADGTGTKYTLVVKNLEQTNANGFSDGYTYSGVVSITIPADKFQDNSGNKNAAKTITIGIDDPTTGDGHNTAVKVDLVDPIWELGTVDLDNGIIKLRAIDKYFSSVTIDEDDIFVYVNGHLDGDTNNNGVIDGTETSIIVKDITSTTPTDIKDTVDGVTNTVVGKEYTLKLSNITPDSASDETFVPTNLNELDAETRGTYVYKYKSENGGTISIKIAAGTARDASGNGNKLTPLDVGNIDATNPGIYEVRKTQNAAGNTETIVFNVTDKNFDPSDLITKTEMALSIDNTNVAELLENATLGTPVEIKTTVDGTPNVVVGHQYTIVISNIAETTKRTGKDYLEWSGTLNLTINANAAKDLKGNKTSVTEIKDFIDYVKPQLEQVTVTNPINTSAKTYTMKFKVLDKYLDTTDLIGIDTDSDGDIDNLNNELTIKVDGEIASDITWNLTYSPITETMNKTVEGAIVSNTHTIGHTYTLVLSEFEQGSKQTASGKDFFEWSGTVSVEIAGTAVKDGTGNNLPTNPTVIAGEHVDFIKPKLEEVNPTAAIIAEDSANKTETIVFNIMDKYLDTTNALETTEFTVYVDGEAVTVDYNNSSSTGLNGTFTKVQDFKHTVNGDTNHIVGQQYKLVLSGFDQITRNSKEYKDYSGTVSIVLNTNAVDDTSNNTLDTANTTVTGDFVDYIKPDIEYTHQDSDVSTSNKKYIMTFDITDKYYSSGVLTLNDIIPTDGSEPRIEILMQNGQLDENDEPIVYNLKNEPVGIALSATPIEKTFNKTVSGVVVTSGTYTIGHTYTLTISNLEQLERKAGLTTADYSGVITVSIDGDMIIDTSNNGNAATTITSGVDFVGGNQIFEEDDPLEVDVVDPIWEKVSSSALVKAPTDAVDSGATTGTSTITIKGTDTYLDVTDTTNSYDDSTLTTDEIEVYIDGVKNTSITPTITTVTPLTETRRVYDFQDATDTETVQYGVQYTMTINGWAQGAKQVKIKILANAIKDETGNGNKATEFIIYNCLESSATETTETSGFLDGNGVGESGPTTGIKRNEIQQVIFVNSLASAPITVAGDGTITLGTNCWDVSAISDKSILAWTPQTSAPYTVYIGSDFEIFANQDSSYLFSYIGCANRDTNNDGTPDETYYIATATDTISNIGALNVSSATNMSYMFQYTGYTLMDTLELGDNFDTSNATNMTGMFTRCGYMAMDTFDLGGNFDTGNVTLMDRMFMHCGFGAMPSLNLGDKFKTSKVTNMSYMFSYTGNKEMTSISFGDDFNTSLVTDMSYMFSMCGYQKLETLDLRPSASATTAQKAAMFNTSAVTNMKYMFNRCGYGTGSGATATGLTNLYLGENFNTASVTDMSYMFSNTGLTKLASLDLGGKFDTSSVENMEAMFFQLGYTQLISLNLGEKFNTTNVENMDKMFYGTGYTKLESLDLGDLFYTTNVKTTKEMFRSCGKTKMKVLDLGPAFTRIPDKILDAGGNPTAESANTDMFFDCGTSALVVYAPESIYSDRTGFKLN